MHICLEFYDYIDRKRCEKQGRKIASCRQAENWKFCDHNDSFGGTFHRQWSAPPPVLRMFPGFAKEPRFISILRDLPISRKQRVKLSNDNCPLERAASGYMIYKDGVWICYFKIEFARGRSCREIFTVRTVEICIDFLFKSVFTVLWMLIK